MESINDLKSLGKMWSTDEIRKDLDFISKLTEEDNEGENGEGAESAPKPVPFKPGKPKPLPEWVEPVKPGNVPNERNP